MAKKKIWLGAAAALLLASGSVLVSCGSSCPADIDCTAKKGDPRSSTVTCGQANCSAAAEVTKDILSGPNIAADASCDC